MYMQENRNAYWTGLAFLVEMHWSEQSAPKGMLTCCSEKKSQSMAFDGIASLICIIDALCDVHGYAERETVMRTLLKRPLNLQNKPITSVDQTENCKRQSFSVTVYYRKYSSIQGSISVHGRKVFFRSGIELMKLINEAMICTENKALLQNKDFGWDFKSRQANAVDYAEG